MPCERRPHALLAADPSGPGLRCRHARGALSREPPRCRAGARALDPVARPAAAARSGAGPAPRDPRLRPRGRAGARARARRSAMSLAQVLVRRGLGDPARRASSWSRGAPRPGRVRRDRPGGRARSGATSAPGSADHRPRRLRRRRGLRHGDHGPRAALAGRRRRAGSCPAGSRTATGSRSARSSGWPTRGTRLLITVDCGITAVEEVAAATAAGLDVVVTDHHAPRADGALPDCPIVHPAVCGYPCPELCGTAVAYKLAQALGAASAEEDLELVALATVADLVPLRGREPPAGARGPGARWRNTAKPGLRALMRVSRRRPERPRRPGARLPAGAADQRRRADAPRRRRSRAAAHRRSRARRGDRRRARRVNAERRAVEQRITWEAEAQVAALGRAQRLRARRRGLASRGDRDRRLADRRAPPPADDPDRARAARSPAPGLGSQHPRLRPARCAARAAPSSSIATAATARPPA